MTSHPFLRVLVAWSFALNVVSVSLAQAAPTESKITKEQQEQTLKHTLAIVNNSQQAMILMGSLGASPELLGELSETFGKVKSEARTVYALKDGKILINGRPSGFTVTSYMPFNIEYKGQVWNYDRKKNFDENFYALRKIIQGKKSASVFSLLVNSANAEEKKNEGLLQGISAEVKDIAENPKDHVMLIAAGVLVAVAAAPVTLAISGVAALAGGVGLLALGYSADKFFIGPKKEQNWSRIFSQEFDLKCTASEITVTYKDGSSVVIGIDYLRGTDKNGKVLIRNDFTLDQTAAYHNLMGCRSEADAAQLKQRIMEARKKFTDDPKASVNPPGQEKTIWDKRGDKPKGWK